MACTHWAPSTLEAPPSKISKEFPPRQPWRRLECFRAGTHALATRPRPLPHAAVGFAIRLREPLVWSCNKGSSNAERWLDGDNDVMYYLASATYSLWTRSLERVDVPETEGSSVVLSTPIPSNSIQHGPAPAPTKPCGLSYRWVIDKTARVWPIVLSTTLAATLDG